MHQQYRRVLSFLTISLIFATGVASGSALPIEPTYAAPSGEYQEFRAKLREYLQSKQSKPVQSTTPAPREWFAPKESVSPAITESLVRQPAGSVVNPTPTSSMPVVLSRPQQGWTTSPLVEKEVSSQEQARSSRRDGNIVHTPIPDLDAQIEEVQFEDVSGTLTEAQKEAWKSFYATLFAKFPDGFIEPMRFFFRMRHGGEGSRGLAGGNIMILRISDVTKPEAASVAIHELGHIVDLGYLKGSGYGSPSVFKDGSQSVATDDPSVEFYSISWKSSKERRAQSSAADFVSGYAMTDPFEDFAESFIMYVQHGEYFAAMAASNEVLAKKYAFMKERVFGGKEFRGVSKVPTARIGSARTWDATLLDYDFVTFWATSFE